jgi:uncharacterized membrane protein (UPF0182 family)
MSRRRGAAYAVAGVLLLLFGGRWAAIRFTEASWFADLGLGRVYWGRFVHALAWQAAVALAATLWYAAQTWAVYRSIGAVHLPRRVGDLEIAEAVPRRTLRWIALGTALLLGVITAMTFSDIPDLVSLYRHAVPLDIREPILGNDVSFYLARMPLLEALHLMALVMVLFGVFVTAALYALTGSITYGDRHLRATPHARSHLVVLVGILALVLAWGFQLDAWGIVGGGGSAQGALDAADRAVRVPASTALAALALVVAAGTVGSLRWKRPGILLTVWVTLALATLLGRFVAPYLSDAWRGRPDRAVTLALAQYADRYSRAGLGLLDDVRPERLALASTAPAESLEALGRELGGLSPWDVEPAALAAALSRAIPDTTRARTWTTSLDRYPGTAGQPVLTVLAVPETDPLGVPRGTRPPDWAALHRGSLSWAGDPVAVAAGAHWADDLLFLGQLSPVGDSTTVPVPVARAAGRIRFLAHAAEPAVIGPDEPPPAGGPAGLRLGGFLRRLLLAWALQMPPLLDRRTSVADRLLVWRDVPGRLARLYPFTTFDTPRAALVNGRLLWIADGYLASARFPLAEQVSWNGDAVNFLRAAYLATVDAVSGATRLYLRPPDMPFAEALAAGMGTSALPSDSLPPDLRQHLGYPEQLFVAQAEMLARHRGDADVTAEPWVPADAAGGPHRGDGPLPPHDVTALVALGAEPLRLWRLLPLTDTAGDRLVAIVAGTCRSDGTPWLRLLRLPETGFPTLAAAENRLAASPTLEAALAEAAGPDGAARRSMVVAVPAAGTMAYAQFLLASRRKAANPLLPRAMALLAANRLGVGTGAAAAARALVTAPQPAAAPGSAATLSEARAALAAMDSALRRSDWAAFGRAYDALRKALEAGAEHGRRP